MLTILSVYGTRPEAIKMAPVVQELARREQVISRVCVTAQHREMLDQALALFDIKPDYDLDVMQRSQDLAGLTCSVLDRMGAVLDDVRPDRVLVHGDTITTLAASLAAFYKQIPVGHVEAGLRTGNLYAPWPEEMSRKLTTGIADLHFAPTEQARRNLLAEGVAETAIHVTGNTVVDALLSVVEKLRRDPQWVRQAEERFPYLDSTKRLVLVTGHRRENFGEGFQQICQALKTIGCRDDVQVVYPTHLNPNVWEPVNAILSGCENIHLIDPVDYLLFVYLLTRAHLILTDSGGIQEEAPALGKPVLVMREVTERPEALREGTARLVGTNAERITTEVNRLLDDPDAYRDMARAHNPYGDGHAARRIADVLCG